MADVRELLAEFVAAFDAGDSPDPNPLLERVSGAERQELAQLIDQHLMAAPRQAWDPDAYEASRAKVAVERVYESIEGVSGTWPELLPQLRNRARIKRSELVARLAAALGAGTERARVEKVAGYYNQMEHGLLPADGVSARVIEALAEIVGTDAGTLRSAGRGAAASGGGEALAFARKAMLDSDYLPSAEEIEGAPASPAPAPTRDEIDELFTGG